MVDNTPPQNNPIIKRVEEFAQRELDGIAQRKHDTRSRQLMLGDNLVCLESQLSKGGQGVVYKGRINNLPGFAAEMAAKGQLVYARCLEIPDEFVRSATPGLHIVETELAERIRAAGRHYWALLEQYIINDPAAAKTLLQSFIVCLNDPALQEDASVAVKMPRPPGPNLDNDDLVERFRKEVRTLYQLHHPNIVRMLLPLSDPKYGEAMVLEYLEGSTLQAFARGLPEHRFPPADALDKIITIAETLDYCHKNGVIHRDVKPSNIMVSKDDELKLFDFGTSKDYRNPNQTMAGTVMGTPKYMAPEQLRGDKVTAATDVYGMTATFFELLTGDPPFEGASARELAQQRVENQLAPGIKGYLPNISPELESLVDIGLRVAPEDRWKLTDFIIAARQIQADQKYIVST
jgi:serine/threonine protein kinase